MPSKSYSVSTSLISKPRTVRAARRFVFWSSNCSGKPRAIADLNLPGSLAKCESRGAPSSQIGRNGFHWTFWSVGAIAYPSGCTMTLGRLKYITHFWGRRTVRASVRKRTPVASLGATGCRIRPTEWLLGLRQMANSRGHEFESSVNFQVSLQLAGFARFGTSCAPVNMSFGEVG